MWEQIWKDFVEPVEEEVVVAENEPTERKVAYQNVVITEVGDNFNFYAQDCETGKIKITLDLAIKFLEIINKWLVIDRV